LPRFAFQTLSKGENAMARLVILTALIGVGLWMQANGLV
jgi:hypothetical protein